jgi:hypothetical protein
MEAVKKSIRANKFATTSPTFLTNQTGVRSSDFSRYSIFSQLIMPAFCRLELRATTTVAPTR